MNVFTDRPRRSWATWPSLICLLIPGLLLPILEINATHLFHPDWPPHARMHEAWQLATNAMLAWSGIVIGWRDPRSRIPHALGLAITIGFILAWLLRGFYGGSMGDASTAGLGFGGIDAAVIVMGVAAALHGLGLSAIRR
ncbi:MAG: hypothetical protein MUE46_05600 [Xanthomonadales bacterium]|jgi:hypothetical protein|nr:hypothetical protein [Xanthomonadales bacterium]